MSEQIEINLPIAGPVLPAGNGAVRSLDEFMAASRMFVQVQDTTREVIAIARLEEHDG